jgi:hypothetical protein
LKDAGIQAEVLVVISPSVLAALLLIVRNRDRAQLNGLDSKLDKLTDRV